MTLILWNKQKNAFGNMKLDIPEEVFIEMLEAKDYIGRDTKCI